MISSREVPAQPSGAGHPALVPGYLLWDGEGRPFTPDTSRPVAFRGTTRGLLASVFGTAGEGRRAKLGKRDQFAGDRSSLVYPTRDDADWDTGARRRGVVVH